MGSMNPLHRCFSRALDQITGCGTRYCTVLLSLVSLLIETIRFIQMLEAANESVDEI